MEQRALLIVIILGVLVSGYLAGCQLGLFGRPWDPIFGTGSNQVLHSSLSRALPIPDALIGFAAYVFELILAGSIQFPRLRKIPWPELLLGIVSALMALGGIFLTLAQIFIVHAGCTLCLCSAALSLIIFGLSFPHAKTAYEMTRSNIKKGLSFWEAIKTKENFDATPNET